MKSPYQDRFGESGRRQENTFPGFHHAEGERVRERQGPLPVERPVIAEPIDPEDLPRPEADEPDAAMNAAPERDLEEPRGASQELKRELEEATGPPGKRSRVEFLKPTTYSCKPWLDNVREKKLLRRTLLELTLHACNEQFRRRSATIVIWAPAPTRCSL